MHFLTYYNNIIVKYDLINKFFLQNSTNLPKLTFISLRFNFKNHDLKKLFSSLVALEFISEQKPIMLKSNVFNLNLKVKKGYPIGCKITLRNFKMYNFILKLLNKIITKNMKHFASEKINNSFSFSIKNILIFNELENNYQFFKNLSNLTISLHINSKNIKFLKFILKSYKIKI